MTDTELLIRETLQSYAEDAELTDLVAGAKVRSRQLERRRSTRRSTGFAASFLHDRRMLAVCGLAAVVLLVGGVFVLGGTTSRNTVSVKPVILPAGRVPLRAQAETYGVAGGATATGAGGSGSASASAPRDAPLSQVASARPASPTAQAGLRGIAATRVVKTGSLGLRVAKGQVGVTVAKLTTIASGAGGYVSRSHT
ncbi:MAG TPA: hypothetical protein VMH41_15090, partial [Mycobacteriales bacterium]|nr:hypothetical protein [Mycobacteriales bacterium]